MVSSMWVGENGRRDSSHGWLASSDRNENRCWLYHFHFEFLCDTSSYRTLGDALLLAANGRRDNSSTSGLDRRQHRPLLRISLLRWLHRGRFIRLVHDERKALEPKQSCALQQITRPTLHLKHEPLHHQLQSS